MTKIPLFQVWADEPPVLIQVVNSPAEAEAFAAGVKFGESNEHSSGGEIATLSQILAAPREYGVPKSEATGIAAA